MIKVLIVDDSPVARQFLRHILSSDPDIQVAASVENGLKAVQFVSRNRPDVIIMDINMPVMDGISATRIIMETNPVPVIIVSTLIDSENLKESFRAMEAGAITAIEFPRGGQFGEWNETHGKLLQFVRLISEVKPVRRQPKKTNQPATNETLPETAFYFNAEIVAIGASTGGPPVIQTIFSLLPKNFILPILVVQHITPGFLPGMVDWLRETTGLDIRLGVQGESLKSGKVYFAPDGFHMGVDKGHKISLTSSDPINGVRPSVSHLFSSVSEVFGKRGVGVLLTGMGKDGASELKLMRDREALTIAQDKESSVIFGMPGEAVKIDAATYVLPPEKIGRTLASLAAD